MTAYRRARIRGGTYFFTVALADRSRSLLTERADVLRAAVRHVRASHPFEIVAMVVLPDHLHAVWMLPPDDDDFPLRWSLIKTGFSRRIPDHEIRSLSRRGRRERGIWQRRYWEHVIRDEADLQRHVDYVHFNPVKHGYVPRAIDWPYSTLHRYVANGTCSADWGGDAGIATDDGLPASAHATKLGWRCGIATDDGLPASAHATKLGRRCGYCNG